MVQRRRWLRVGLYALAGIFAALVIVISLLVTVDLGMFRDRIETFVTDLLQRELRIDGAFHANLGMSIDIYAEDAFFANPEWAAEAAFVSAKRIDISVDTWSLFNRPIRFNRAEIQGLDVNIEFSGDGRASWTFDKFAKGPEAGPPRPRRDFPIMWNNVLLDDVDVSFAGASGDPFLAIRVDHGSTFVDEGGYLETQLQGALNDYPVVVHNRTGPVDNVLAMKDVASTLNGSIGDIVITSESLVDDVYRPTKPTLDLHIEGPGAEYVTDVLKLPRVTEGPFSFSAGIHPTTDALDLFVNGKFGEFDLDVTGQFVSLQEPRTGEITVTAAGPDIATVMRAFGISTAESDPFSVKGRIARQGSVLTIEDVRMSIGESNLSADGEFPEFPGVTNGRLSVIATGPDYGRFNRLFGMPGRLGGAFRTTLDVAPADGGRTNIELQASAPDLTVNVQSSVTAADGFVASTARLRVGGPDIGKLLATFGIENVASEGFDVMGDVEVDASGYRLKEVRAIVGDDILELAGHVGRKPLVGETDVQFNLHGSDLGGSVLALGGEARSLPKGAYHLRGQLSKDGEKLVLRNVNAVIGDDADYEMDVDGFLLPQSNYVGSELAVRSHGASLSALGELVGQTRLPNVPFDLSANLNRAESATRIGTGEFSIGDARLQFKGQVADDPMHGDVDVSLDAAVPDLKSMLGGFGLPTDAVPQGDLAMSAAIAGSGGRLAVNRLTASLGNIRATAAGRIGELPGLQGTALQVSVKGPVLADALPKKLSRDQFRHPFEFAGGLQLADGELKIEKLSATLAQVNLRGDIRLGLDPLAGRGEFKLTGTSPDLFELFPESRETSRVKVAPMRFNGNVAWRDNLWKVDDFDFRLAEGGLKAQGSVYGPPSFEGTDLRVEWITQSIANLGPLIGRVLPDESLRFTAHVIGTRERMSANDFELVVGPSDLHGDFTMAAGTPPKIELQAASQLLDVSAFQPDPKSKESQKKPPKKDRVIPDTPIPMDVLRKADAVVQFDIGRFKSRSFNISDIAISAKLLDGALTVDNMKATGQRGGHFSLQAELSPDATRTANFGAHVTGSELAFGLLAKTEEDLKKLPVYDLRLEMRAFGGTIREMAGSLNAYVRLLAGTGQVRAGSLQFLTQDFITELLDALNPFSRQDAYINVQCAAILLQSIDGKVTGQPALVQQTDKLRVSGDAVIDLKTEKIDATFSTVARKGLGLSLSNLVNPYIKVVGTLASPALSLNPEGALLEGGAAVATGGLSILAKSLAGRFLSDDDPCGKAVAEADKRYDEYMRKKAERDAKAQKPAQ